MFYFGWLVWKKNYDILVYYYHFSDEVVPSLNETACTPISYYIRIYIYNVYTHNHNSKINKHTLRWNTLIIWNTFVCLGWLGIARINFILFVSFFVVALAHFAFSFLPLTIYTDALTQSFSAHTKTTVNCGVDFIATTLLHICATTHFFRRTIQFLSYFICHFVMLDIINIQGKK